MTSVTVSELGEIFAVGFTCGVLDREFGDNWYGELDAFIRKYDADGTVVWSRQFGTSKNDAAWGVAVGRDGNPVVSGFGGGNFTGLRSAGDDDVFLRKFDRDGNTLWTQQFGSSRGDRSFNSVAIGPDSSVYISGSTDGAIAGYENFGDEDGILAKFTGSGEPVWVRQFGTPEIDGATSVEVDSSGHIYVGGGTDGPMPGATHSGSSDGFVLAYNGDGDLLWTREFGTEHFETVMALDVGRDGNLFVAGARSFAGGGEAFIHEIESTGETVRLVEFGTDGFDFVFDIKVKQSGQVIAVGHSAFGEDQQIMIVRLDSGSQTPTLQHFGTDQNDSALGVAVAADGAVYVVGELNRQGSKPRATEEAAFIVKLED